MTVTSAQARVAYQGNGSTTAFSVPFRFDANADLVVIEQDLTSGTQTLKTLTTDYTLSGAGNPNGGTLTANSAPSAFVQWTIYRDPAITQSVDVVDGDPLPAASIEGPMDRLTMIAQRLSDRLDRSLHQPDGDSAAMAALPPKQVRVGTLLAFDSNGDPTPGPTATDVSSAQTYAANAAASATAAAASAATAAAIQSKIPDPSVGNALKYVRVKSDGSAYEVVTVSGSGTVTGPGTSTSRSIALWNAADGTALKDGPALGSAGAVLVSGGAGADPSFTTVGTSGIAANAVTLAKLSRSGSSGQVLTSQGAGADPIYASLPTPGEANTASNQGTGSGWFKQKSGVDLQFRSLKIVRVHNGPTSNEFVTDVSLGLTVNTNDITLTYTVTSADAAGGGGGAGSCFPAGSLVTMADGTLKAIELVMVGDKILGRFGEVNEVLALERPLLGTRKLVAINGTHWTTDDHPHWTEGGPMVINLPALKAYWGRKIPIILGNGERTEWLNPGLSRPVGVLVEGMQAIYNDGLKEIETIHAYDVGKPELTVYNLVLDGSHTMRVDGYLVTAWPREDDFDYDKWEPRHAVA